MARTRRDRRPARSDSKAAGPARVVPAGFAKCSMHGATLPVEQMQPGLPKEWACCKACWAKSLDTSNKRKNPGEAVGLNEVTGATP